MTKIDETNETTMGEDMRKRTLIKFLPTSKVLMPALPKFSVRFFALTVSLLGMSLALPAWKTITHVHLTLVCRQDAIDDGKLTIYEADYENSSLRRDARGNLVELGRYEVHPFILTAIRQYPDHLKAGAIGTDILPDLLTAQVIVHPDNSAIGRTISNDWLALIWSEAQKSNSYQAMAFAAGYLAHGAGDLFGHSFINHYAGGAFDPGRNALKHIVLESYIDKRTPTAEPNFFRFSIQNIDRFLYNTLVVHPLILRKGESVLEPYRINLAPPRLFLFLADWVRGKESETRQMLNQKEREYSARIAALLNEASTCLYSNPVRYQLLV
ncbi:MAG: zinc dependent phospholipase C family protein, partial [candidate division WOR-3 bacterium]